jgi:glutamyl-Q tRNA(Asp) synthetase
MATAVASCLDARAHQGQWLVRIEDLDPPREVPGAAKDILDTLEAFGLRWDGDVLFQSDRHDAYQEALNVLLAHGRAFGCVCTRKTLAGEPVYPGHCRGGLSEGVSPRSFRFAMPEHRSALAWSDRWVGEQQFEPEGIGDFVLKRADGFWAYHMAVVVDDAHQAVTDVVRGDDLLDSTPAHLALVDALSLEPPRYAHVPVVKNAQGQKLSKQTLAEPVDPGSRDEVLRLVFGHLGIPWEEGVAFDQRWAGAIKWWRESLL